MVEFKFFKIFHNNPTVEQTGGVGTWVSGPPRTMNPLPPPAPSAPPLTGGSGAGCWTQAGIFNLIETNMHAEFGSPYTGDAVPSDHLLLQSLMDAGAIESGWVEDCAAPSRRRLGWGGGANTTEIDTMGCLMTDGQCAV